MASNLNDTVPAAPAGGLNVKWQTDGSGNDSAYLAGGGIPSTAVDLTAQTADISPSTLYAVPVGFSGMYRVAVFLIVTQAATVSSTLPAVSIVFTDNDNNTSQTLAVTAINLGNVLTTFEQGEVIINVKDSTTVQYVTVGSTTVGATALNYALHVRIEPV